MYFINRESFLKTMFLMFILSFSSANAHDFKVKDLVIDHPWLRETSSFTKKTGGYFTVMNQGSEDDRLISVSSEVSRRVEIHQMVMKNGVMSMRSVDQGVQIPAGKKIEFQPSHAEGGSYHLMFIDLEKPFIKSQKILGKLIFEKSGEVLVEFAVEDKAYKPSSSHDHKH